MPAIQGTKLVAKEIYAWLQAHKKEGIVIEANNKDGLEVHVDSDWGGMHSVCGEVRSRSGVLINTSQQGPSILEIEPTEGNKHPV